MSASGMGAAAIGDRARRLVVATLGAVAFGALAIASAGCAAASLWLFAVPWLGPAGAPLLVACILLATGVAVLMLTGRGRRRSRVPPPSSTTSAVLLADAIELLKDHKAAVLMAALVAGLTLGRGKE